MFRSSDASGRMSFASLSRHSSSASRSAKRTMAREWSACLLDEDERSEKKEKRRASRARFLAVVENEEEKMNF